MVESKAFDIVRNKQKIRKEILTRLRSQDSGERLIKSSKIKEQLFKDEYFKRAESVMFYVSKEYEVDTEAMIEEALAIGKRVMVPVTETRTKNLIPSEIKDPKSQFCKGPFGIHEPKKEHIKKADLDKIDLIIVPGVAFDKHGNRLGHGEGYFDRFLKSLPKKVPAIGLAYDFQLVERIETLSWDIPVTKVITA